MTCENCAKNSPTFDLQCFGCRDRIVMSEDCKFLRKQAAQYIDEKFGFLPDYKKEPHCGCTQVCKRKAAIKNEQQADISPKKTSRSR